LIFYRGLFGRSSRSKYPSIDTISNPSRCNNRSDGLKLSV
jgi:hypothetical protein